MDPPKRKDTVADRNPPPLDHNAALRAAWFADSFLRAILGGMDTRAHTRLYVLEGRVRRLERMMTGVVVLLLALVMLFIGIIVIAYNTVLR